MLHPRKMSHLPSNHNKFTNSTTINDKSSLINDTGPSDITDPTLSKIDSTKEDTLTASIKNQSFDTSIFFIYFWTAIFILNKG